MLRQRRLPNVLDHGDCVRLIKAVEHPVYRNCLNVMYSCGLRLGEAVRIEVSHIDKFTGNLTVIGKRNYQRLVPIPPTTLIALRETWKIHKNKRYLFPNRYGKTNVSDCTVRAAFHQARQSLGFKDVTKTQFCDTALGRWCRHAHCANTTWTHQHPFDRGLYPFNNTYPTECT